MVKMMFLVNREAGLSSRWLMIGVTCLLCACTSDNANYPQLKSAFGRISQLDGSSGVVRHEVLTPAGPGSSIYVGDEILIEAGAWLQITLAPGQVVELKSDTRWLVDNVVSNGAAYGSETRLMSGELQVHGEDYMPHQFKIVTPVAEITTFSENFRLKYETEEDRLSVMSFDEVPIVVSNRTGLQTIKSSRYESVVMGKSAPTVPVLHRLRGQ